MSEEEWQDLLAHPEDALAVLTLMLTIAVWVLIVGCFL